MKTRCALCVVLAAAACWGHTFDKDIVNIVGIGNTGKFKITDPTGCSALVTAQSLDTSVATVAPLGPISVVTLEFTVTAKNLGQTGILVKWAGDVPGKCDELGQHLILVNVTDFPKPDAPPGNTDANAVPEPVMSSTGALFDFFDDLFVRGPILVSFERFYWSAISSETGINSALGNNWMHNYDLRLEIAGPSARLNYYQGKVIRFRQSGSGWVATDLGQFVYQLAQSGTTFQFLDPSTQLLFTFNAAMRGRLEKIEDRNGNALSLAYNGDLLSRVTDATGNTLDFSYTAGNLTRVQDQSGRAVTFTYTNNVLTRSTDTAGQATVYSYVPGPNGASLLTSTKRARGNTPFTQTMDAAGRVASQTDASGNTTTFAYRAGAETSVNDPTGATWTFKHQGRNLIEQQDGRGNSLSQTFDSNSRVVMQTDREGNITTYTYHAPTGFVQTEKQADGSTTTFTYSPKTFKNFTVYDLTAITYPDGASERMEYDNAGNLTARVDRAGERWQFTYNARGQASTETMPTGARIQFGYNNDATLASLQMPDQGPVTFTYDALKRITSRSAADGNTRKYTYDAYGNVASVTDERGAATGANRDTNGQLSVMADALGGRTAFAYNGNDDFVQVTDPSGRVTALGWDAAQRPAQITFPDGAAWSLGYDAAANPVSRTDGEGKVWRRGFDRNGREISMSTPQGETVSIARDSLGRVVRATAPSGRKIETAYDTMGRARSSVDENGGLTQFRYNARGELTAFSLPDGTAGFYSRDAAGQIIAATDPNGNIWKYGYDGTGRLLSATDPLGNTTAYARDARGRLTSAALPLGTAVFNLDALGLATRIEYSDGTAFDLKYDLRGRIVSGTANSFLSDAAWKYKPATAEVGTGISLEWDASGSIVNANGIAIDHDSAGRVWRVGLAPDRSIEYTYDKRGLLNVVRDWNGPAVTFEYDNAGRLARTRRANGAVTTYTYDGDGNLISLNDDGPSGSLAGIILQRDARSFIVQAQRDVPLNRTPEQLAGIGSTFSYDAASQVTDFNYDALGRRTSGNGISFTWNLASQLTAFDDGTGPVQFTYDPFGLMLSQTNASGSRQFVWNYSQELPSIAIVRQDGKDAQYYVSTPQGELLYSVGIDGSRTYFHFDENGNTQFLTDGSGTISDAYAYSPDGLLVATNGTTPNPFTFAGQFGAMSLGDGLYDMRGMVYDSATQSFLSRSGFDAARGSPYSYAGNNVANFINPAGRITMLNSPLLDNALGIGFEAAGDVTIASGLAGFQVSERAKQVEDVFNSLSNALQANPSKGTYAENVNVIARTMRRWENLDKTAKKLNKLGKAGTALQIAAVGVETYNAFNANSQVFAENDILTGANEDTYTKQVRNIWQLYKEGKITLVTRRRLMFDALWNSKEAALAAGNILDFSILLNGMEFYKNGLNTFTPVPGGLWDRLAKNRLLVFVKAPGE